MEWEGACSLIRKHWIYFILFFNILAFLDQRQCFTVAAIIPVKVTLLDITRHIDLTCS